MSKIQYPKMVDVADGKQVRVETEDQHRSAYPEDYEKVALEREREEQLRARTPEDMISEAVEAALDQQEKKFQVFLDRNKLEVDAKREAAVTAAVTEQKEQDAQTAESFQQSGKVVSAKIAAAIRGVAYEEPKAPAATQPAAQPAAEAPTKQG